MNLQALSIPNNQLSYMFSGRVGSLEPQKGIPGKQGHAWLSQAT